MSRKHNRALSALTSGAPSNNLASSIGGEKEATPLLNAPQHPVRTSQNEVTLDQQSGYVKIIEYDLALLDVA
ncbi:hypothetical protein RRG08_004643 [Elysia crispata]|uniref:Uncharacterized protein n=1 Tax=Elysia crispata TaxID=231223 RepID=A0AAE0ZG20_9GAST|nr:hypothetical protein RRG08_004643 [Elysia crispata]